LKIKNNFDKNECIIVLFFRVFFSYEKIIGYFEKHFKKYLKFTIFYRKMGMNVKIGKFILEHMCTDVIVHNINVKLINAFFSLELLSNIFNS